MKKFFYIIISLVIIALIIFFIFKAISTPKESYLSIAKIEKGNIIKAVNATGIINPVNVVNVGTQVSGEIIKIYVEDNSYVKKGDLLAEIDPAILEKQLEIKKAALGKAKLNMQMEEKNKIRYDSLLKKGYISEYDWQEQFKEYQTSILSYEIAQKEYEAAKLNLGYTKIYSPITGIIISKEVEEGQTVASSLSTPDLFTIAEDLTKMQIEASIAEADIGMIKKNMEVNFTVDAFPYETFMGKVEKILLKPTTSENVVTYTVLINVDNKDSKLYPGMTAFTQIIIDKRNDVLLVPNSVLKSNTKKKIEVFIKDKNNHIQKVLLEKGLSDDLNTEILNEKIEESTTIIEFNESKKKENTSSRQGK